MKRQLYNRKYYQSIEPGSSASASEVISVIQSFISPASVVDIGCGTGAWLAEWKKKGATEIHGIDGKHIRPEQLLIDMENFQIADLEKMIYPSRKFDLVTSLEVAEHISPDSAVNFIHSICQFGEVVLFSAAIPGQGGVNHINEQYPDYWIEIFKNENFSPYDFIREKIWFNKKIDACYRQNLLFFVKNEAKEKYPSITMHERTVLPLVHPEHFEKKEEMLLSYKKVLRTPFHTGWHFIKIFIRFLKHK